MPFPPKISRRNFIRASLYGGIAVAGGVGYARVDRLEVVQAQVTVPHQHLDGLTIAVLSDFHAGAFLSPDYLRRVIDQTNDFKPDLVCLLGDYVDGVLSRNAKNLVNAGFVFPHLAELKAKHGVFAVLGNHDHWIDPVAVTAELTRHGITVLNNAAQRIGNNLLVAGVDDYWEGPASLSRALKQAGKDDFVVLLSHNPDINQEIIATDPVNLVLSGHTHGGQVRIPFLDQALWVPCSPRYKNNAGLIKETERRSTFVSKGVGTFFIPIRLNCAPDIGIIQLKKA